MSAVGAVIAGMQKYVLKLHVYTQNCGPGLGLQSPGLGLESPGLDLEGPGLGAWLLEGSKALALVLRVQGLVNITGSLSKTIPRFR